MNSVQHYGNIAQLSGVTLIQNFLSFDGAVSHVVSVLPIMAHLHMSNTSCYKFPSKAYQRRFSCSLKSSKFSNDAKWSNISIVLTDLELSIARS